MDCGEFFVKCIMFITNLIFALVGLALLALGIAAQLQISAITNLANGNLQVAPISSMIVGSIVFLVAFFGCCGVIRESNCMLVTYSISMLVLMLVKVALAILLFVRLDNIIAEIPNWLNKAFVNNQQTFQTIELAFQCCGPDGPSSYGAIPILPQSCCATSATTLACHTGNAFPGCNTNIADFFSVFGIGMGITLIILAAFELLAAVFGLCLANRALRSKRPYSRY